VHIAAALLANIRRQLLGLAGWRGGNSSLRTGFGLHGLGCGLEFGFALSLRFGVGFSNHLSIRNGFNFIQFFRFLNCELFGRGSRFVIRLRGLRFQFSGCFAGAGD